MTPPRRRPTTYLIAILLAYTAATWISPDMFGAPAAVRAAINLAMLVLIIVTAVLLIKELTE